MRVRVPAIGLALALLPWLPGCPDKDPIDEAMEEMEFAIDTGAIYIDDAEDEPEPMVRRSLPPAESSGGGGGGRGGGQAVATAEWVDDGPTISADDVVATVRKRKGQVRSCYEKELKGDPELMGIVSVAFTVAPTGNVSAVRILANSTGNRDMESCIQRTVDSWSFPASHGAGVDVEYPFKFVPGS